MARRRAGVAAIILAGLFGTAPPAQAHPHVWITYLAAVAFKAGKITGLKEQWVFDEDFSTVALQDLPTGAATAVLKPSDVAILEKFEFSNLKNYAYFHHVFVGGQDLGIGGVENFTARLDGRRLVYNFVINLKNPVDPHPNPVEIGIWDDTFFVDVEPISDNGITLEGDGTQGCTTAIVQDQDHAIFDGLVVPPAIQVSCGKSQ